MKRNYFKDGGACVRWRLAKYSGAIVQPGQTALQGAAAGQTMDGGCAIQRGTNEERSIIPLNKPLCSGRKRLRENFPPYGVHSRKSFWDYDISLHNPSS